MERLCSGCVEFEACVSYPSRNIKWAERDTNVVLREEYKTGDDNWSCVCVIGTHLRDAAGGRDP